MKKKMTNEEKLARGWIWIYTRFITRKGIRIYPKKRKILQFFGRP